MSENGLGITAVDLPIKLLDFVQRYLVEIRQGVYVNMDPAKYSTWQWGRLQIRFVIWLY
jgi:hypothetical protein